MSNPKSLVAGNWKMNGLTESLAEIEALESLVSTGVDADCSVLICPPFTLISAATIKSNRVMIGAQDCHESTSGAHTGDISAQMLKDAGASHVIVGHSERRADHFESSNIVKEKAESVLKAGLIAIVCVGETEAERDAERAMEVVIGQIEASLPVGVTADNTVVAYEPVWAIGTGRTPTVGDVAQMHTAIREALVKRMEDEGSKVSILYGGSVKPSNAEELMAADNVNGALVGGASLKASDFNGIIEVYRK